MLKASLRFAWRSLNHLTRVALVSALLLLFAGAGALLTLRYWVLPDIERYHDKITAMASQAIGQPVRIGSIEADWHGFRPRLRLTNVRILDSQGQTALALLKVENEVSWSSLFTGELRLYSLQLNQPDLQVKRDASGRLYIAGILLSGSASGNGSLADWLLDPARIVVRDARITWIDEQRASPPLVLQDVNLLVANGWRRHRFALRALPPAELAAQIDLRGDFYGTTLNDLSGWAGQLYTQLDYADVAAWRSWLTLPVPLRRGRGALRGWLGIENGKISQMTADLALSGVRTRLAEDLPPLDVSTLHGRVGWREVSQGIEISTSNFSLRLHNGFTLPPTDFYLHLADAQGKRPASGEVRANKLNFLSLVTLSDFLPFDRNLKQKLAEFAPRGRVTDLHAKWQDGPDNKLLDYEIRGHFEDMSLRRVDNIPGFSGLTGQVDGNAGGGTLSLNARKLTIDAPRIMKEPLLFDSLTAQASWHKDKQGVAVKLSNVSVANADLAGSLYGSYHTLPDSPGEVDMTAHLTRGAVSKVDRYIPLAALDKDAHDWLSSALVDGQADDFNLRLRGNLNDFPFPDNKKGMFQIRAHAKGGVLEYDRNWPRIDNINADLLIEGNRLEVTSPSATTLGERLQKVSAVLPDMASPNLMLEVRGEATGETARGLDFIQKSPVRGYIGGFTDGMAASGNGMLKLHLDIPLLGSNPLKVAGTYHFQNNDVMLGSGVPRLRNTSGDLLFSESALHTQGVTAQIFGGPAQLEVHSGEGGAVHATVSGNANFDAMRKTDPLPILDYLSGSSAWNAQVDVLNKHTEVRFDSNLLGVTSTLPAPFAKLADEAVPLSFEQRGVDAQQDTWTLQYGKLLSAKFLRRAAGDNWKIKRGTVDFGNTGRWVNRDGVWLVGTIPQLSLEGWSALGNMSDNSVPVAISGADLLIRRLSGYGQTARNLHVSAHVHDDMLRAQLASDEINGEVTWQPKGKGKLSVHLKQLMLEKGDHARTQSVAARAAAGKHPDAGESPDFEVAVDSLGYKGKQLGKLEMLLQQRDGDWQLQHMAITNPDGVLTADGKWHAADATPRTQVNFTLQISNAGNILARSGYPNSVKGGSGKLAGAFSWSGSPDAFSYAALDGTLRIDAGKGQFLKIDPGIGKLLGILSLQALPKRITLDFTDVFSEGFEFDSITGDAQIAHGLLTTNNFRIDGSAAKVTMIGQVDMNRETQNLRVRILPTVGDSVSLLGAFAAGPAVGIGTFIANKLLREPLDKLVSFEYNVTGTWVDPSVTKVGESRPAAMEQK
ncbi:MAG: TIGR02099 family protein [Sideroxydans sp.]|nr:TIGR02099 family protein [Sideroxydans sp.]